MDFFQRQEAARRSTLRLSVYFLISVALITLAMNALVYLLAGAYSNHAYFQIHVAEGSDLGVVTRAPLWVWPTCFTLLVIGGGTLFTWLRLSGGGRSVARMMDARLVDLNTTDPRERRLINVVEEMSIASGTPVPELYIQDGELGINAFVAGYHIREAVLVVTEGALAKLNRSELQGVIGHEFSHILNGDMRINVRLISVLAGIVLLSQLGSYLMRSTRYTRASRDGRSALAMGGAGIALFVLGYVGLFFGRMIKAAISRQREYLADAASVQFTRNPDGLASALFKLKTHKGGSLLEHPHAEDMSHMCFGETVSFSLSRLFATHPDIDARIKAIHPRFVPPEPSLTPREPADDDAIDQPQALPPETLMGAAVTAGVLMNSVGSPTPDHVDYARRVHGGISERIRNRIHEPLGARSVIYALVLADAVVEDYAVARRIIAQVHGEDTASSVGDVLRGVRGLGQNGRLPLVELTFPALGRLHRDQKDLFIETLERVVRSDKRYTLFEFALLTLIRKHLMVNAGAEHAREINRLDDVKQSLGLLVSLFAALGANDPGARSELYASCMRPFALRNTPDMVIKPSAEKLNHCLIVLDRLSPLLKRPVLNACADCVAHDGMIKADELELLRATSAALDCPMPPLINTAKAA